jgi:protein O-mannosyl-transferase
MLIHDSDNPVLARPSWALPCAIILVAIFVRANSLGFGFVYDDEYFLFGQPAVVDHDASFEWLWQPLHGLYRPIRSIIYALLTPAFGRNPLPYRIIGIALDATMAVLLFLILKLLFCTRAAFVASLVWLLHPTHSERVVLIIGSFDIWGLTAMMAALYCALKILVRDKASPGAWIGLSIFTPLAVFANEEALLLPVYFFVLAVVHFGFSELLKNRRAIMALALMGAFCCAYLFVRVGVIGLWERADAPPIDSGGNLIPIIFAIVYFLFSTTFIPLDLHEVYPPYAFSGLWRFEVIVGIAIVAAIIGVLIRGLWKRSYLGAVAGWWLVAILPFSNLVANVEQRHVRYLYMPTLALALLAAFVIDRLQAKSLKTQKIVFMSAAIILVAFFALAVKQNRIYRDSITLWGDSYENCQNCSKAAINYGIALAKLRRFEEAREVLLPVLVSRPGYEMAFVTLAAVEMDKGRTNNALALLAEALKINANHAQARRMFETIQSSDPPNP